MNIGIIEQPEEKNIGTKTRDREKLFIKILEDDPYFNNKVSESRKILNIPENGIKINNPLYSYYSLIDEYSETYLENKIKSKFLKVRKIIETLVSEYNLNLDWLQYFWMIIKYNLVSFNPEKKEIVKFVKNNILIKEIQGKVVDSTFSIEDRIFIEILDNISLEEFVNWAKKNWKSIPKRSYLISGVLRFPKNKKINLNNIDLYKVIYKLRNNNKKKFTEIADIVEKKFNKIYGETEIRVMFSRYTKYISRLRV